MRVKNKQFSKTLFGRGALSPRKGEIMLLNSALSLPARARGALAEPRRVQQRDFPFGKSSRAKGEIQKGNTPFGFFSILCEVTKNVPARHEGKRKILLCVFLSAATERRPKNAAKGRCSDAPLLKPRTAKGQRPLETLKCTNFFMLFGCITNLLLSKKTIAKLNFK